MHDAAESGAGIWKLAKWGRTSQGPAVLPVMPPLKTTTGVATTLVEKVEALRAKFYPIVQADLSNIYNTTF